MTKKPMTREELRKKRPEYDNSPYLEKIIIEGIEDTYAGRYREWAGKGIKTACGILTALYIYHMTKDNPQAVQPTPLNLGLTALFGYFVIGNAMKLAFTSMAYEIFSPEGDIGKYWRKNKNEGED